jgi:hypothetical protein
MRKRLLTIVLTLLAAALGASAAAGDGGPAPGPMLGGSGVLSPSKGVRYVAFPSGRDTLVATVAVNGGRVGRWRIIRGGFGVPTVAFDGTTDGVSRDGKTLVLASWTPQPAPGVVTRFAVLSTAHFGPRKIVKLRGAFSFDALSPDGKTLYVIEYLTSPDPLRYRVRAVDLVSGRLYPGQIVDRREPDEQMNGQPVSRAWTRDGGWAFTLYSRNAEEPFVHALDTRNRAARCIDLPWRVRAEAIWSVRLGLSGDGRRIVVRQNGKRLAVIDTSTFAVRAFRKPSA